MVRFRKSDPRGDLFNSIVEKAKVRTHGSRPKVV
jgi:hypothetical protein